MNRDESLSALFLLERAAYAEAVRAQEWAKSADMNTVAVWSKDRPWAEIYDAEAAAVHAWGYTLEALKAWRVVANTYAKEAMAAAVRAMSGK